MSSDDQGAKRAMQCNLTPIKAQDKLKLTNHRSVN